MSNVGWFGLLSRTPLCSVSSGTANALSVGVRTSDPVTAAFCVIKVCHPNGGLPSNLFRLSLLSFVMIVCTAPDPPNRRAARCAALQRPCRVEVTGRL